MTETTIHYAGGASLTTYADGTKVLRSREGAVEDYHRARIADLEQRLKWRRSSEDASNLAWHREQLAKVVR